MSEAMVISLTNLMRKRSAFLKQFAVSGTFLPSCLLTLLRVLEMQKAPKGGCLSGLGSDQSSGIENPLFQSRRTFLSGLSAKLDEAEQDFVTLRLQLLDGARSHLGMDAVDELLLHFRG